MVSDCGRGCEDSKTTYSLEMESKRDGVRLRMRIEREQNDVLSEGGEGA